MKKLFLLTLLPWFFLNQSCGTSYDESEVKNYTLYGVEVPADAQKEFKYLVSVFNKKTGFEVLRWVDTPSDANSPVILTAGLDERDGKVGWGQWMSETEQENQFNNVNVFSKPKRTTQYSMRLELDKEYVTSRLGGNEAKRYELMKLFFHEIGHGLQMDHDPDPKAVMYYDISGNKDFDKYFEGVRAYFAQ